MRVYCAGSTGAVVGHHMRWATLYSVSFNVFVYVIYIVVLCNVYTAHSHCIHAVQMTPAALQGDTKHLCHVYAVIKQFDLLMRERGIHT